MKEKIIIKPCPFCLSKSELYYKNEKNELYHVRCNYCNCNGPTCEKDILAIELWNNTLR